MTNIIISSEMRVGSRWLHYLLKDLYGMKVSPEIGRHRVSKNPEEIKTEVHNYFMNDRIVKFHGLTPDELFELLPREEYDYKAIFVVRNPRDRGVSLAFHHKHEKGYGNWKGLTDEEVLDKAFLEEEELYSGNQIMFETMIPEYSTKAFNMNETPYIWTCYEWMIEDTLEEVGMIDLYLQGRKELVEISEAVELHSFKNKSGREEGQEERSNTWRRKGIVGDWINHFNGAMFDASKKDWDTYWDLVESARNLAKEG